MKPCLAELGFLSVVVCNYAPWDEEKHNLLSYKRDQIYKVASCIVHDEIYIQIFGMCQKRYIHHFHAKEGILARNKGSHADKVVEVAS